MHILVQYANELRQARVGPRVWWQDKSRRNTLTSVSQISKEDKMRACVCFLVLIASFWFLFIWIFGYFSFRYFSRISRKDEMRARLFFLVLIASFGYFTLGLALAWPASALPSIRFVLVPFLDQTVTFTWIFNSVPFYSILPSFHTTLFW